MNLKRAIAIGGSAGAMLRHALCVFPVLPSLNLNENPLVVPPLLGNKRKKEKHKEKKEKRKKHTKKKQRKTKKNEKTPTRQKQIEKKEKEINKQQKSKENK